MTHDPLCDFRNNGDWADVCDECRLIARVREDERMRDDDYAYVATQSYAAALRDATYRATLQMQRNGIGEREINLTVAAIEALGND